MLCKFMHFLPVHPLFVMCHLFSMPHALLCHKMLNTVLQTLVEIFIFSKKSWKMRKKEEICIKIYPKHVFLSLHHMLVKGFIPRKNRFFHVFRDNNNPQPVFLCKLKKTGFLQNFAANFLLFSFFSFFAETEDIDQLLVCTAQHALGAPSLHDVIFKGSQSNFNYQIDSLNM